MIITLNITFFQECKILHFFRNFIDSSWHNFMISVIIFNTETTFFEYCVYLRQINKHAKYNKCTCTMNLSNFELSQRKKIVFVMKNILHSMAYMLT